MEEKDLVWLPKSLAEKVKQLTDAKAIENEILKYLEDSRRDIINNIESLDDEVLQYKATMIKFKQAFRDAKEEQLQASYELWEKYDKDLSDAKIKVEEVKKVFAPIRKEIGELTDLLKNIDAYRIDKLVETIQLLKSAWYGDTKDMLLFLMNNYKKSEVK